MEIIRKNKVKLIRWLRADDLILQHVQSGNLITMDEYTKLKTISDPGTQITELLDVMLQKEDKFCMMFLDLLKDNDVNESSPALREWIRSVNITSGTQPHAPQPPQGERPGHTVNIDGRSGLVATPIIISSNVSGLSMNISQGKLLRTSMLHNSMAMNNRPRITDNQEFLNKNRGNLVDKVKAVNRIVDDLSFTGEKVACIQAEQTEQAKMRKVLEYTTTKKAAQLLVDALYKHEADIMEELTTP